MVVYEHLDRLLDPTQPDSSPVVLHDGVSVRWPGVEFAASPHSLRSRPNSCNSLVRNQLVYPLRCAVAFFQLGLLLFCRGPWKGLAAAPHYVSLNDCSSVMSRCGFGLGNSPARKVVRRGWCISIKHRNSATANKVLHVCLFCVEMKAWFGLDCFGLLWWLGCPARIYDVALACNAAA